jgi:hypothetical protein
MPPWLDHHQSNSASAISLPARQNYSRNIGAEGRAALRNSGTTVKFDAMVAYQHVWLGRATQNAHITCRAEPRGGRPADRGSALRLPMPDGSSIIAP